VSGLRSALEELSGEDLSTLHLVAVEDDLGELLGVAEALEAEILRRLAVVDRHRTYQRDGHLSTVSWLVDRFRLSRAGPPSWSGWPGPWSTCLPPGQPSSRGRSPAPGCGPWPKPGRCTPKPLLSQRICWCSGPVAVGSPAAGGGGPLEAGGRPSG
jgi:hypothetical protein